MINFTALVVAVSVTIGLGAFFDLLRSYRTHSRSGKSAKIVIDGSEFEIDIGNEVDLKRLTDILSKVEVTR
ncbi:MAG: hypothetical protein AAFQ87_07220 [Bacteroidota bacterium]